MNDYIYFRVHPDFRFNQILWEGTRHVYKWRLYKTKCRDAIYDEINSRMNRIEVLSNVDVLLLTKGNMKAIKEMK